MKETLKDQLSKINFSAKDYGSLPLVEKTYELSKKLSPEEGKALTDKWETLRLIRKNLIVLDKYINQNKGEQLNEWLHKNKESIADRIKKELGGFNDKDKGISVYFLNLQNVHDQEEKKYDDMEELGKMSEFDKAYFEPMSKEREEKRKNRETGRNAKFKDFKKDGKGFLVVEEDPEDNDESVKQEIKETPKIEEKKEEPKKEEKKEPEKQDITAENMQHINADADTNTKKTTTDTAKQVQDKIDNTALELAMAKSKRNIVILLAGSAILLTVFVVLSNQQKDKKTE
jgi:hypothetical protein